MRIAVISYHTSPLAPAGQGMSGGMNVFIAHLYGRLTRANDVDIFVFGKTRIVEPQPRLRVVFLNKPVLDDFADAVIEYHNRMRYDVIHSHYWLSGLVGIRVKKKTHLPWLHSFHTIETLKGLTPDKSRVEAEDAIMNSCDLVVSPTEHEAFEIGKRTHSTRTVTIAHGVDSDHFRPTPNGHNSILYVGRVDPIKGLDILIDAFRMTTRKSVLVIVGGPSKEGGTYESIKTYGRGLNVDFVGRIPHEQLHRYYRSAAMVIIPSYYESFGLVGLEAMASGRPVIGFNDTSLCETIPRDAGIIIPRGARNLASAVDTLLHDPILRYHMGRAGRAKACHNNWHAVARKYHVLYEKFKKN